MARTLWTVDRGVDSLVLRRTSETMVATDRPRLAVHGTKMAWDGKRLTGEDDSNSRGPRDRGYEKEGREQTPRRDLNGKVRRFIGDGSHERDLNGHCRKQPSDMDKESPKKAHPWWRRPGMLRRMSEPTNARVKMTWKKSALGLKPQKKRALRREYCMSCSN